MPPKGFKSITIKTELYEKVAEKANKESKTITQKTTEILEQDLGVPAE